MGNQGEVAGFWSYATEDNRLDGGALLALATALMQEFDLISGKPLNLFVDRDSIAWGDEWRIRIDSALTSAAFFIPIITPRYFNRAECRRELLDFYGKAKSVNLERLILPINYIDVADLREDSSDEAMAIIAGIQHVDWRNLRLEGPTSADYKKGVHVLAKRLHQIERETLEIQLAQELEPASLEDLGLQDLVEEINSAMPEWLKAVWGDKVNSAQMRATFEEHRARLRTLRARRSPRSAILATQLRFGPDMLPLVERFHSDAQVYLSRSSQLNPLMLRLSRHLKSHPRDKGLADHILEGLADAIDSVVSLEAKPGSRYPSSLAHLSQTLKRVSILLDEADAFVHEGNEIVVGWWNMGLGKLVEGRKFRPVELRSSDGIWVRADQSEGQPVLEGSVIETSPRLVRPRVGEIEGGALTRADAEE